MTYDKGLSMGPSVLKGYESFETILDTACERLWDKKVQYSIRQIQKMDAELENLERELDKLICGPSKSKPQE
jgi:hypothetical protein